MNTRKEKRNRQHELINTTFGAVRCLKVTFSRHAMCPSKHGLFFNFSTPGDMPFKLTDNFPLSELVELVAKLTSFMVKFHRQ